MKLDVQTVHNRHTRAIIIRYWLLLAAVVLLGTAVAGCSGSDIESAAVAQEFESTPQQDPTEAYVDLVTVGALRAAEQPPDTATPTTIPTLTPLPTASATLIPTLTATATATSTATATAEIQATHSGEPPTPTKQPPLPTPSGVYSWTLKVPVLMYHYISELPDDADKYRKDLSVTPADFEQQMAYLVENGYESVDLYDLSLAIAAKKDLPKKPVVITLDDGYVDNYKNAFPILQEQGIKATFFVVTEFIDEGRAGYMNWEMVKEMSGSGMRIEPHSKTHPDLSIAERDYVIYEVLGSQETIAAQIGYTPRYFCYPGGEYDEETMSIVEELGFWGAVTTADGTWHGFDDRFEWSRIRMRNTTHIAEFADMVNLADTVSGKPSADS